VRSTGQSLPGAVLGNRCTDALKRSALTVKPPEGAPQRRTAAKLRQAMRQTTVADPLLPSPPLRKLGSVQSSARLSRQYHYNACRMTHVCMLSVFSPRVRYI
jgi:hypothetical protein